MDLFTSVLSYIAVSMSIAFWLSVVFYGRLNNQNKLLKKELKELIEIKESLIKDIKFQANVNKTLREGLDAITKKNCHVKNIQEEN